MILGTLLLPPTRYVSGLVELCIPSGGHLHFKRRSSTVLHPKSCIYILVQSPFCYWPERLKRHPVCIFRPSSHSCSVRREVKKHLAWLTSRRGTEKPRLRRLQTPTR
ncbi:hypothetical protein V8C34DRAFT_276046 [Trichoderma compactum]